jgi:hypothetical protein
MSSIKDYGSGSEMGKGSGGEPVDAVSVGVTPADDDEAKNASELAASAVISYNTMNILHPPKRLMFGQYNNRPIDKSFVKILENDFTISDFTPGLPRSMIPIMLDRSQLDIGRINTDMGRGVKAPKLKLAGGVTQITVLGGHHRQAAVSSLKGKFTSEIAKLDKRIEKLNSKSATAKVRDEIANSEAEKKNLGDQIELYSTWGVIVYDAGTY